MIVDDEPEAGMALVEVFETLGWDTTYFDSPTQCLTDLQSQPRSFDVTIVDLAMPEVNGLEFFERSSNGLLRTSQKFIMTGLAELNGKEIETGPDIGLILKPFTMEMLIKKMGHPSS